jgi:ABC-type nitrate/sulfonate/bicarbonate transport system substrate-binding protein
MNNTVAALFLIFLSQVQVHAADKIRIGYPDPSGSFLTLPLGEKAGFFQKEGFQSELIRIRSTVALAVLVSGEIDYQSVVAPGIAAAIRGVPVKSSPVTRLALPPRSSLGLSINPSKILRARPSA